MHQCTEVQLGKEEKNCDPAKKCSMFIRVEPVLALLSICTNCTTVVSD